MRRDAVNGKKTEVTHIRIPSELKEMAKEYQAWRRETHPRLKLQDAMREALYVGLVAMRAFTQSIGQQEQVEQELSRYENVQFATKYLGSREAVESQY